MLKRKVLDTLRSFWKIPVFEQFLLRYTVGREFGKLPTKLPPNNYQYKKGTVRNLRRDGIKYNLDISDYIEWYIYFGFKEISRVKLYNLVSRGDILFDIGANIGEVTLQMAKAVGNDGKVHSFEPDPINFEKLKKNVLLNQFSNITLNKKGLGKKSGAYRIYSVEDSNRGMNRILNDSKDIKNSAEIEVITLDQYIAENKIEKVGIIKIDVEGYEMNILEGAVQTLERHTPLLFLEVDDKLLKIQNSSAKDLLKFLHNRGYKIYHAETDERITCSSDFKNCHYDVICKCIK